MSMGQAHTKLRRRAMKRKNSWKISRKEADVNDPVNMDDYQNVTRLWLATRYDDLNFAILLMSFGADVDKACGSLMMSPLHMAACNENVDLVTALLQKGADPNTMDRWNYTPLMYAAIHCDPYIVNKLFTVLIEYGADVNFGARINEEGLMENAENMDIVELQSSHEGEYITYVRDPMGPTSGIALHHALQNPHLPNESIELLLHAGADLNFRNLYGQTPLIGIFRDMYYDYHSNVRSHAELLVKRGADLSVRDRSGWTCFHYAAQRGSISCMEMLLYAGADCNVVSHVGESPFWILLANGWQEATEFLLRNGCEINRPASSHILLSLNQNAEICRYGAIRPLEFALCNRFYKLAELMVRLGCIVDGDTWLGSQIYPPHPDIASFLEFLDEELKKRVAIKSLQTLCRDTLRCTMMQGITVKVASLSLPQALKDCITME